MSSRGRHETARKLTKNQKLEDIFEKLKNTAKLPTIDDLRTMVSYLKSNAGTSLSESLDRAGIPDNILGAWNSLATTDLVIIIITYDDYMMENNSTHIFPVFVIESIIKKRDSIIEAGKWFPSFKYGLEEEQAITASVRKQQVEEKKEEKAHGEIELRKEEKLIPFTTKIPHWLYLGSATNEEEQLFAKLIQNGESVLIGQINGFTGILINGYCNIEQNGKMFKKTASRESCAIPLTVAKISKILKIKSTFENFLIDKNRLISLIANRKINITTEMEDSLTVELLVLHLKNSSYFKDSNALYIEKVELETEGLQKTVAFTSLEKVDVNTNPFKKSAINDAGRVFMFEMMFGNVDINNHFVMRSTAQIVKVFANPKNIRIRKIIELAKKSINNTLQKKAESQFFKTKTIMDDAQFIQGMNEVRWKIFENSETIKLIISNSDIPLTNQEILYNNIDAIRDQKITIADLIDMTFNEKSPFRVKARMKGISRQYDNLRKKMKKIN